MIIIYEGKKKVAEMPDEEFWEMTGDQKRAFVEVMDLTGRSFSDGRKEALLKAYVDHFVWLLINNYNGILDKLSSLPRRK